MSKLVSSIDNICGVNGVVEFICVVFPILLPFYFAFLVNHCLSRIDLLQAEQLLKDADFAEKDDLKSLLVATDFRPRKYQLERLGSALKKREATRLADETRQRIARLCN